MSYQINFSTASSQQIARALGKRLEQIRLARNFTQARLAEEAAISVRTLRNLEKGASVSLDTFFRVLGILGVQQNLEALLPDPAVRPIERVENRGKERKRASSQPKAEAPTWTWGDGESGDE